MKREYKNKRGITLIALVITIIVLLILAGISISMISSQDGILKKAVTAKERYEEGKVNESSSLNDMLEYIESETGKVISNEKIEGTDGEVTIPKKINLNDCGYVYKLNVESTNYNGEITLKVYGMKNESGVMEYNAYSAASTGGFYELRDILYTSEFNSNSIPIKYTSTEGSEEGTISYNKDVFGDNFAVTSITEYKKKYTGYAYLVYKTANNEEISTDDLLSTVEYELNQNDLGYKLFIQLVDQENKNNGTETEETKTVEERAKEQEEKERALLNDIMKNKKDTVEAVRQCIVNQVNYTFYYLENTEDIVAKDDTSKISSALQKIVKKGNPYTLADFYNESQELNEATTRLVGNGIIPCTVLWLDELLEDLNDNGKIVNDNKDDFSCTDSEKYLYYFERTGNAAMARLYADFGAVVEKYNMSFDGSSTSKDTNFLYELMIEGETKAQYWNELYEYYQLYELDNFYKIMYDNNIKVNVAGFRMAYNSIFAPQYKKDFTYDMKKDTKYIEEQGVSGIINELDKVITDLKTKLNLN